MFDSRRAHGGSNDTAKGSSADLVPWRYRNIINPWQTPREIRNATKFLDRMFKNVPEPERIEMTREQEEDRQW